MSQFETNNRGAIWMNAKTKESQPDFTGSILVDGKDYFLVMLTRRQRNDARN